MAITEVEVDQRGRTSLKSAGIQPGRYRVTTTGTTIQLEPVTSYTRAELLALQDPEVKAAHQNHAQHPERATEDPNLP